MSYRLKSDVDKLFEVFIHLKRGETDEPTVYRFYPDTFDIEEEIFKTSIKFSFPYAPYSLLFSKSYHLFNFVTTNIESKFTFGFALIFNKKQKNENHSNENGENFFEENCLCFISHLPYFQLFQEALVSIFDFINDQNGSACLMLDLLSQLYQTALFEPNTSLSISLQNQEILNFECVSPEPLQSIPQNQNLTELFKTFSANSIILLFKSILYERRILLIGNDLYKLTSCSLALPVLLYPMTWQHLFIPILPPSLIEYCCAPMPYIISIHKSNKQNVEKLDLSEVVMVDVDEDEVSTPHPLDEIPDYAHWQLKKQLKQLKGMGEDSIGERFTKTFLGTMTLLIGNYRNALRFRREESITFDPQAFVNLAAHHPQILKFYKSLISLQCFLQFVQDRLNMLNSGTGFKDQFEVECSKLGEDKWKTHSRYKEWMSHMKRKGKTLKKEGRDKWTIFANKVKNKSKHTWKEVKLKIEENKKDDPKFIFNNNLTKNKYKPPRPPPPFHNSILKEKSKKVHHYHLIGADVIEADQRNQPNPPDPLHSKVNKITSQVINIDLNYDDVFDGKVPGKIEEEEDEEEEGKNIFFLKDFKYTVLNDPLVKKYFIGNSSDKINKLNNVKTLADLTHCTGVGSVAQDEEEEEKEEEGGGGAKIRKSYSFEGLLSCNSNTHFENKQKFTFSPQNDLEKNILDNESDNGLLMDSTSTFSESSASETNKKNLQTKLNIHKNHNNESSKVNGIKNQEISKSCQEKEGSNNGANRQLVRMRPKKPFSASLFMDQTSKALWQPVALPRSKHTRTSVFPTIPTKSDEFCLKLFPQNSFQTTKRDKREVNILFHDPFKLNSIQINRSCFEKNLQPSLNPGVQISSSSSSAHLLSPKVSSQSLVSEKSEQITNSFPPSSTRFSSSVSSFITSSSSLQLKMAFISSDCNLQVPPADFESFDPIASGQLIFDNDTSQSHDPFHNSIDSRESQGYPFETLRPPLEPEKLYEEQERQKMKRQQQQLNNQKVLSFYNQPFHQFPHKKNIFPPFNQHHSQMNLPFYNHNNNFVDVNQRSSSLPYKVPLCAPPPQPQISANLINENIYFENNKNKLENNLNKIKSSGGWEKFD